MMQPNQTFRRAATLFVAFAALALQAACGPAAAGWFSFNPPVGSRWIVETENKTDDVRPSGHRTVLIRSRAEMTIDGKTADGFNVTYVLRSATAEGNDPSLPLLRSAMQALGDIPIHATTDARGKPIRLDNPEEAEAAIYSMVDKVSAPIDDKPQVAAVLHRMLTRLTEADAINYLAELPALAKAQGAGELKSSLGFGLKDAMQELTQSPARNLLAAAGSVTSPVQLFIALMQMNVSFHMHSHEQGKDGMMLKMTQETVTTAHAFSYDLRKTESKTITMTPAP